MGYNTNMLEAVTQVTVFLVSLDQRTEQHIGVEADAHQCSRAHCTASAMRMVSSVSLMPAVTVLA
jgi:hypothetical protein